MNAFSRCNWCHVFSGTLAMFAAASAQCWAGVVLEVPRDQATIQAAVDAVRSGDTVLVSPGTYRERIRLKDGVTLRSAGDDAKGRLGLKRAEATIIDGGEQGEGPGVAMAEGAILDGFTITNVGRYDDAEWQKHHATQGDNQPHEHIGEPGIAGVSVVGVTCVVRNNVVHHIGYTGIAVLGVEGRRCSPQITRNVCYRNMGGGIGSMKGSTALVEENICFQNFYAGIGHSNASPVVLNNVCYENIRAGIGVSEGAKPVVRNNRCYKNRRAGIGIRSGADTSPVIESNECFENDMAGIGCEEQATPIIRGNQCYRNAMAGIGCQDHAAPLVCDNECRENELAGIGARDQASPLIRGNICRANKQAGIGVEAKSNATILDNQCLENGTVAIGVRHESSALIVKNKLERTGGMPPLIAIREQSSATILNNQLRGGGVAGVLVDGSAAISDNDFRGDGPRAGGPPNFAVWVQSGADVTVTGNDVDAWRHAVYADGAKRLIVSDNAVRHFLGIAVVVKNTARPAQVTGNAAYSENPKDQVVKVEGPQMTVEYNDLKVE